MPEHAVRMFEWTEALAVGCAEIDGEHRSLFDMAERLHQAMLAGRGRSVLDGLLAEVTTYCLEHFAHEEELMGECGFPDARVHCELHRNFRATINSLSERYQNGENTITLETLRMLSNWLLHHVSGRDRALGVYVTALRAQLPPEAPASARERMSTRRDGFSSGAPRASA